MATKKRAPAKGAGKTIVAFALVEHVLNEGEENQQVLTKGQQLELGTREFNALKKEGVVEAGKFVKMRTGIEGRRYSLKPHDTTWLPTTVFEAWAKEGYCVLSDEDPGIGDALQAREAEAKEAQARCIELEGQLQEAGLQMQAALAQAIKVRDLIEPDSDSGDVLDDESQALLAEVVTLIDLFPDALQDSDPASKAGQDDDGSGDGEASAEGSEEPELKLN